eukprot:NODE_4173_length_850_cov_21.294632_g3851_i0.p1 GENE.NODE_4173_length_850_cov_21.294632_g3851_i0~~NODE_4173_length_850_cov_21.294632_g3851_i0.p1  ORF type:complete len:240 (+),score=39.46 NODE_4173_length_850_cov_21.294632_g3851_i0:96-815(+)
MGSAVTLPEAARRKSGSHSTATATVGAGAAATAAADVDPFNINRFAIYQAEHHAGVLANLRAGRALESSPMHHFPLKPRRFAVARKGSPKVNDLDDPLSAYFLTDDKEAVAYLKVPVTADGVSLRSNYICLLNACFDLLMQVPQAAAGQNRVSCLCADPEDARKLRSSIRLFERISCEIGDEEVNKAAAAVLWVLGEEPELRNLQSGRGPRGEVVDQDGAFAVGLCCGVCLSIVTRGSI